MTKGAGAPIRMRVHVYGESIISGMRFFPRVWLSMLLLTPPMTGITIARIKRAGGASRLIPTSASAALELSTELPTAPQDPTKEAKVASASSSSSSPSSSSASTSGDDDSINLIIPVEGVRPDDLRDSFDAIRSGGRLHRAIDIMAPCGTPVLAATDGELIRLSQNKAGGNTIYQMSDDKKLVFYYAHLDSYADDLAPGDYARQGDVIGYVGDTGNAGAGNCHLHFSIWAVTDPKKYWQGDNINPYPLLRDAR